MKIVGPLKLLQNRGEARHEVILGCPLRLSGRSPRRSAARRGFLPLVPFHRVGGVQGPQGQDVAVPPPVAHLAGAEPTRDPDEAESPDILREMLVDSVQDSLGLDNHLERHYVARGTNTLVSPGGPHPRHLRHVSEVVVGNAPRLVQGLFQNVLDGVRPGVALHALVGLPVVPHIKRDLPLLQLIDLLALLVLVVLSPLHQGLYRLSLRFGLFRFPFGLLRLGDDGLFRLLLWLLFRERPSVAARLRRRHPSQQEDTGEHLPSSTLPFCPTDDRSAFTHSTLFQGTAAGSPRNFASGLRASLQKGDRYRQHGGLLGERRGWWAPGNQVLQGL